MRNLLDCCGSQSYCQTQPAQITAPPALVGTWRVTASLIELDGQRGRPTMGTDLQGLIIFTPTYYSAVIAGSPRKLGTSLEERAVLWDTLLAYAGRYTPKAIASHSTLRPAGNKS